MRNRKSNEISEMLWTTPHVVHVKSAIKPIKFAWKQQKDGKFIECCHAIYLSCISIVVAGMLIYRNGFERNSGFSGYDLRGSLKSPTK